jgi:hypothetical protein
MPQEINTKEPLNLGDRIKYVVERNPHPDTSAPEGTYEGKIIDIGRWGSVQTEEGMFRGVMFTIECDDGRVVETSMMPDRNKPLT